MSKNDDLTERQKEFARLLAQGAGKSQAYRKAFNCKGKSDASVASSACRLAKNVKVLQFLADLSQVRDEDACLGRAERMKMLSDMARKANDAGDVRAAVACLAEMNKMDGSYAAEAAAAAKDDAFREAILRGSSEPLVRLG